MLDFNKLVQQIESVSKDSLIDQAEQRDTLLGAISAFENASVNNAQFIQRLEENAAWVLWPLCRPLEALGERFVVRSQMTAITVIGVDGSQIMPSHHEVHTCYLLNIGYAIISYNSVHKPILNTVPHLYHRREDLYPLVDRRRLHIDELYVSLERNLLELQTLSQLALENQARGLPVVALVDGSLIPWSVEKLPDKYQQNYLERMALALAVFKDNGVPLIGYLSNSRATDVVNTLRVSICPYERSDCRTHCATLNEEDFPCSKIWPVSDRQLFSQSLAVGERSCSFISAASVGKLLPAEQRICFAYLNVGAEIARIEFPRWLYGSLDLFQLALQTVLAQAEKGLGYPVCLSEAHHLAVIRGADRERFYQLMASHMIDLGLARVRTSPKESRKRIGFV
jgi:NurA domain